MLYDDDTGGIDTIPRKLSFVGSFNEDQLSAGAQAGALLISYKSSSHEPPLVVNYDVDPAVFSLRDIYKNLLVLSMAFLLLFTSYTNIVMLQSSMNTDGNVGVNSLVITYVSSIVSAIFLVGPMMDIFGLKWSILFGAVAYLLYIVANIRPFPSLMYITAVLVGLGSAPLWTAQAFYINRLGRYYAYHKRQIVEVSVRLFFGLFSALQGTNLIWGNLISYFVLKPSEPPAKTRCGIHFDPLSNLSSNQTESVNETTRYVLCGIFVAMGVLSMIVLCLLLDQIRLAKRQTIRASMKKSVEVLISLVRCKYIEQIFLIPITMWALIQSAFLTAQFTRAFITCLIGIRYVGLVLVAHGTGYVISSYVFGWLAKYIGRQGCFITAALLDYAMITVMYLWQPDDSQMFVLFLIAGVWGTADAIWQCQLVATYTLLYSESDPTAVVKYRLWKSVGSVITFGYSSYITIRASLAFLLIFLSVSMISYGIVEVHLRWKARRKASYIPVD